MKSLFAFLFLVPSFVHADDGSAIFVAAVIGGVVASSQQTQKGSLPDEVADWADPATQSTTRLAAQCGLLVEMKLIRTGTVNAVFLGLRNESSNDVTLGMDRVKLEFSDGRARFGLSPFADKNPELRKNWYAWGLIPFPRKWDFKNQSSLDVTVPVQIVDGRDCQLKTHFQRNSSIEEDEATFIEAPTQVGTIGAFGLVGASGVLADVVGDQGAGIEFSLAGYRTPRSGLFMDFALTNFTHPKNPGFFGDALFDKIQSVDLSIGKSWRIFHGEKFVSTINFGPGIEMFSGLYQDKNAKSGDSKSFFMVYASYSWNWIYENRLFGPFHGQYALGVSLFAKYLPSMDHGGGTFSGVALDWRGGN